MSFVADAEIKYLEDRGYDLTEHCIITWPESQLIMRYTDDIELINDEEGLNLFGPAAFIVPNWLANEVWEVKIMTTKDKIINALYNCVACFVDDDGLCFPVYNEDLDTWHFEWYTSDGLTYNIVVPSDNFRDALIVDEKNGIFEVKDKSKFNVKIQVLTGMEIKEDE